MLAPLVDPKCAGTLYPHRETLAVGRVTEIAAFGEQGTYRGASIYHFEDGTFNTILSLEVFGQPWMPDAGDHGLHAFGDHCVRIVDSSDAQIILEVALQPDHVYDSHRCHMGCCVTEAQRQQAPDGSVECCFCSDAP